MGWFDDNHWAGEAYNFGLGYMSRSSYADPCGAPRGHRKVSRLLSHESDPALSAERTTGGRNALTGKFFYGTRKCSVCSEFKTKDDFEPEEVDESAAKRCCMSCSRMILQALESWEAKTPSAPPATAKPVVVEPPTESVPVVIGRTHKVFGPDKSSFGMHVVTHFVHQCVALSCREEGCVGFRHGTETPLTFESGTATCPCGCKQSAPASMWFQGEHIQRIPGPTSMPLCRGMRMLMPVAKEQQH